MRALALLLLIAAVSLAAPAGAQSNGVPSPEPPAPGPARVSGVVRDAAGETMAGVSVYLSGTTRGASTDAQGRYQIAGLAAGSYRLVGSMIGYAAAVETLQLAPGAALDIDLRLTETTVALGTVQVEARTDRRWQRRLAWFRRTLIGESANADSTRILNPEVLDFRVRWGTLTATAAAPLVIENRALGYRLAYDLHAFRASEGQISYDGDEVFEELTPASAAEGLRWAEARERAWRGSLRHLLRAMLGGTAQAEGYTLTLSSDDPTGRGASSLPIPTTAAHLIRADRDGVPALTIRGWLEVTYDGEPEEPAYLRSEWFRERRQRPDRTQRSSVRTERGGARLNPDGTPADPFAISTSGHMAFERLADLVPRDSEPDAGTPQGDGPETPETDARPEG